MRIVWVQQVCRCKDWRNPGYNQHCDQNTGTRMYRKYSIRGNEQIDPSNRAPWQNEPERFSALTMNNGP